MSCIKYINFCLHFLLLILLLGAQCTNLCNLKGTVGCKAVVGAGAGLGLSSLHPLALSHVTLCPQSCSLNSHMLTAPGLLAPADGMSNWGWRQQWVRVMATALITPQEQEEVEKPPGAIRASI